MVGQENEMHRGATIRAQGHKTMEQIPEGLSQQAMTGPTKVLDVTAGVQNRVAKI
jgi:hypothetical protein